MRLLIVCLICSGCIPKIGPRVSVKTAPRIYAANDIAFAAGLLAENGFLIAFASREANVVNTYWRGFVIEGDGWEVVARDRVQASATAAGILVQYDAECYRLIGMTLTWGACHEPTKKKRGVEQALKARYEEIWTSIRNAAHAAPKAEPSD